PAIPRSAWRAAPGPARCMPEPSIETLRARIMIVGHLRRIAPILTHDHDPESCSHPDRVLVAHPAPGRRPGAGGTWQDCGVGSLMLLDTASLYYRAFYGMPETVTAPDGTPVNAIRGLLDAIARLVRDRGPQCLVACLDADWRPQFRVDA